MVKPIYVEKLYQLGCHSEKCEAAEKFAELSEKLQAVEEKVAQAEQAINAEPKENTSANVNVVMSEIDGNSLLEREYDFTDFKDKLDGKPAKIQIGNFDFFLDKVAFIKGTDFAVFKFKGVSDFAELIDKMAIKRETDMALNNVYDLANSRKRYDFNEKKIKISLSPTLSFNFAISLPKGSLPEQEGNLTVKWSDDEETYLITTVKNTATAADNFYTDKVDIEFK